MLPKQYSFVLRKESSFFSKARRSFSPHFTYFFSPSKSRNSQVVVIVGKKTAAKATQRNKLKRQLYNSLYEIIKPEIKNAFKLVLVPKQKAVTQKKEVLQTELQQWFGNQV